MKQNIILASLWIGYLTLHSLLASLTLKTYLKKHLPKLFVFYRLIYNCIAMALIVAIFIYQYQLEADFFFQASTIKLVIGISIFVVGNYIILHTFMFSFPVLEFAGLDFTNSDEEDKLIIKGLSKEVRHPLYLGVFLISWGTFIAYSSDLNLIMATIFTTYILIGAKLEEKKLSLAHEEYANYQKTTPFLFPSLLKRFKKDKSN